MNTTNETRHKRSHAGNGTKGVRPHSVKTEEITALFIKWGIIGELPEARPKRIRLGNRHG